MEFKLSDAKYEKEVNDLGYTHHYNAPGYTYPGETLTGYSEYLFKRKIDITEVSIQLNINGNFEEYRNTWVVK
jgi:hypothetical protein